MPKRKPEAREGVVDWLEDYYREPDKKDTDYECATKTKLKYSGAQAGILEDYNIAFLPKDVTIAGEDGSFQFNTGSCSFCHKYLKGNKLAPSKENCKKCPIAREGGWCEARHSPWNALAVNQDPQPMLDTIDRILEKCTGPRWSYKAT